MLSRASFSLRRIAATAKTVKFAPGHAMQTIKPSLGCQLSSTRFFSKKEAEKKTLHEVVRHEIDHEKTSEEVDQEYVEAKALIEKSFKIHETAGKSVVKLTRTHGKEQITISFDVQDMIEEGMDAENAEEDDVAPSESMGVHFVAEIINGNTKMIVDGTAGQYLSVQNVRFTAPSERVFEDVNTESFGGPEFDSLDEEVQEAMLDYLEDRMIDGDLAFFILSHAREKEQVEYVHWLETMAEFTQPTTAAK